jgi:hypothetical protein
VRLRRQIETSRSENSIRLATIKATSQSRAFRSVSTQRRSPGYQWTVKNRSADCSRRGEGLAIVIIVLAILGGAFWYLESDRRSSDKQARAFAQEVSERVVAGDQHFLDFSLSPEAKVAYPPSWRTRTFEQVRTMGKPLHPVNVTGKVAFKYRFFEPVGVFRGEVFYAAMPGYIDLTVSPHGSLWQIDKLNFVWYPPVQ